MNLKDCYIKFAENSKKKEFYNAFSNMQFHWAFDL